MRLNRGARKGVDIAMKIQTETMKLYAVTDRSWLKPGERLSQAVEELLEAGVTLVQLREKEAEDAFFLEEAIELRKLCDRYGVPLIINDRPDIAKQAGAAGVHVGLSDMGIEKARDMLGEAFVIGGSAHNVAEARRAREAGADYLGCGAVFGSSTKRDVSLLAASELKAICQSVDIPVVAIGGIRPDNLRELAGCGIAGAAVISGLFAAADKKAAVEAFLEQLKTL